MNKCKCGGSGWVTEITGKGAWDFRVVPCGCGDHLSRSGLEGDDLTLTLDDLTTRADDQTGETMLLKYMAHQMLKDPYGFLTMSGPSGNAKSLVAKALTASFCRLGIKAKYYTMTTIALSMQPRKGERGEDDFSGLDPIGIVNMLKRVPVLVIDEMDKPKYTPYVASNIGDVIEYRHDNPRDHVTILSMNRLPEEWVVTDGAMVSQIGSRIRDGRFDREWPSDKPDLPFLEGARVIPGLFQTRLHDIRPRLKREAGETSLLFAR